MMLNSKKLNELHSRYLEKRVPHRRFSFELFKSLLEDNSTSILKKRLVGKSIENREIYQLSFGSGPISILVWTQMHGNESTATRAFLDLLRFFNDEENDAFVHALKKKLSIHFIPVLNPDGLERYQRQNALGIDPNRDARKRETPEINVLYKCIEELKPTWCFNMHDQRNLFNVSGSEKPATIAFLSPNTEDGELRKNRLEAMQLIDVLNADLQLLIPGAVSRFTHEYYPRAMGDNLQELGYNTILVESGGALHDEEREVARRMNFVLLLMAFQHISSSKWKEGRRENYESIPKNDQKLFDFLIKDVSKQKNGHNIKMDIGIDRVEVAAQNARGFDYQSQIRDIGDLKDHFGYETLNARGMRLINDVVLKGSADIDLLTSENKTIKIRNGFVL